MLKKLIIAAALACAACLPAKHAAADTTTTYEVDCAPHAAPAPVVETIVVKPGYVWSRGYWYWAPGARWVWVTGRHVKIVAGYRWFHPHYTYVGRRWVFMRGRWAL